MASRPSKPPLPPRQGNRAPMSPHAHDAKGHDPSSGHPVHLADTGDDPRKSSNESILPEENGAANRRKLLLVYIHGFMGDETSFRSFPAHVHNVLTVLLSDTHVVHSKLYPRFRSKRYITYARDNFSTWLEPHESPTTDVILLGHSMGGLVSAEVALMPPAPPAERAFKHRILGTINFDVPFLGMHPGVIRSGLASIFKPSEETHGDKYATTSDQASIAPISPAASTSSLSSASLAHSDTLWDSQDPNFNPNFKNDVVLPVRKFWSSVQHFVQKHRDNLPDAAKQLVGSHAEFMSAMSNYNELKSRYTKLRLLEEDSEALRKSIVQAKTVPPRIRFVNYYTASTGRPKRVRSPTKDPVRDEAGDNGDIDGASKDAIADATSQQDGNEDGHDAKEASELEGSEHTKDTDAHPEEASVATATSDLSSEKNEADARDKLAEEFVAQTIQSSETKSATESADQKGRNPEKLQATTESTELRSDTKRSQTETESLAKTSTKDEPSRSTTPTPDVETERKDDKPLKDRKFCSLPPRDSNGERDPKWARVFMKDVDEVGAHCGMFFVDEQYQRLVGDVAIRIEGWVLDDLTTRLVRESEDGFDVD